MKRKLSILLSVATFLLMLWITPVTKAQDPPHPPQSGHGVKGNQSPAGNAKVGDGISILIAFALAYSYKRFKQKRSHKNLMT